VEVEVPEAEIWELEQQLLEEVMLEFQVLMV
jgi:hypothetical protein